MENGRARCQKKIIVLAMPKEDAGGQEVKQIIHREASPQGGKIAVRQRKSNIPMR